ncbi:MAG: energy transducer TonB [Bacteroidota bacterium]|nr:energy transducer TonB [Bacteroidota bacterium]
MKNNIIILLLSLLSLMGSSQNSKFEYLGRSNPSVKKEKLKEAKFICDITPEFWGRLAMPEKDRVELDHRRKMDYSLGSYLYTQGGYDIIDYISVEILATCNGKVLMFESTSDKLTTEQKNILNAADLSSNIRIKIMFKYKNQVNDNLNSGDKIIEGQLTVTVVPEIEAEYPGGFKQLTKYFTENVINKVSKTNGSKRVEQAIVKFNVNEQGQIVDAKILRTSTDPQIDKLLLDATNKMPKWKPAENSKGIKIKQGFSIPFGGDGC